MADDEACGEVYAHLRRTVGGLTPGSQCSGFWCNEVDCDAWDAQAQLVFGLVRASWNKLHDVGDPEPLREQVELYERDYDNLPECSAFMAFGAANAAGVIAKFVGNINLGICALELLNRRIEEAGSEPIRAPVENPKAGGETLDEGTSPWVWVGVGLGAATVITLGVLGYRYLRRDTQAPSKAMRLPPSEQPPALREAAERANGNGNGNGYSSRKEQRAA